MKITHLVVHYAATFPEMNVTAATIDRWHRERGFRKIGYHYFIRRNGLVETGRAENEVGAHVGGQNTGKLGICWAGGLERGKAGGHDNKTPEQEAALITMLRRLAQKYPTAKVVGHRDLAPTECPGYDVIPWWDGVRAAPDMMARIERLETRIRRLETKA